MTTAAALLVEARSAGLLLVARGARLHVEPTPPAKLLGLLRLHKPAVMAQLRAERQDLAVQAFAEASGRICALRADWPLKLHVRLETEAPLTWDAVKRVDARVDAGAAGYVAGDVTEAAFKQALADWERVWSTTALKLDRDLRPPGRTAPRGRTP